MRVERIRVCEGEVWVGKMWGERIWKFCEKVGVGMGVEGKGAKPLSVAHVYI